MATTDNRALTKLEQQGAQYVNVNTDLVALDAILSSLASISIATDHTVTEAESQHLGFKLTGTLTANQVLTVPFTMPFLVQNATSGAYTVTVKYDGSDTGVVVDQGSIAQLYSDGVNVVEVAGGGGSGSGDLLSTNNLSDLTSASTARTNLGLGDSAVADIGTGSGDVAAGDDSRIVGAVQKSLVAAKGDLIGATANDTPAIVTVGTNGSVLTADSGATNGIGWAGQGGYIAGKYYSVPCPVSSVAADFTAAGKMQTMQFLVVSRNIFDRIAVYFTVGAVSTWRLGVYADDGHGYPGALVLDAGTLSTNATGEVDVTISQELSPGLYHLAVLCDAYTAAPSYCALRDNDSHTSIWGIPSPSVGTGNNGASGGSWRINSGVTTGAMPNPFTAGAIPFAQMPRLWLRSA
jgi:hypothetical protein